MLTVSLKDKDRSISTIFKTKEVKIGLILTTENKTPPIDKGDEISSSLCENLHLSKPQEVRGMYKHTTKVD